MGNKQRVFIVGIVSGILIAQIPAVVVYCSRVWRFHQFEAAVNEWIMTRQDLEAHLRESTVTSGDVSNNNLISQQAEKKCAGVLSMPLDLQVKWIKKHITSRDLSRRSAALILLSHLLQRQAVWLRANINLKMDIGRSFRPIEWMLQNAVYALVVNPLSIYYEADIVDIGQKPITNKEYNALRTHFANAIDHYRLATKTYRRLKSALMSVKNQTNKLDLSKRRLLAMLLLQSMDEKNWQILRRADSQEELTTIITKMVQTVGE